MSVWPPIESIGGLQEGCDDLGGRQPARAIPVRVERVVQQFALCSFVAECREQADRRHAESLADPHERLFGVRFRT
jgi:hypothetical protein